MSVKTSQVRPSAEERLAKNIALMVEQFGDEVYRCGDVRWHFMLPKGMINHLHLVDELRRVCDERGWVFYHRGLEDVVLVAIKVVDKAKYGVLMTVDDYIISLLVFSFELLPLTYLLDYFMH